ncbi:hypothetical protein [Streptomyces sp. NBC_00096]|uniref:hypothetical protein n=1 Tax=Streptomyces sp. NBC_00096 TaxID=2975650 RepID=UPI00324B1DA9
MKERDPAGALECCLATAGVYAASASQRMTGTAVPPLYVRPDIDITCTFDPILMTSPTHAVMPEV